jgi:hypothetical protein
VSRTSVTEAEKQEQLKKIKPEIKLGATVRLRVHSGEIVEGQIVHMWEEKSAQMVRVASGDLVYNIPARMLVDETKSRT